MKTSLLTFAALVVAASGAAFAQSAPLRGLGLLALDSSASQHGLGSAAPGNHALVDMPDGGGGTGGGRAARGGDAGSHSARAGQDADAGMPADTLPSKTTTIPPIDSALPAAPSPRHPSYRWQTLVPGALK